MADEACGGLTHRYSYEFRDDSSSGYQFRVAIHAFTIAFLPDDPGDSVSALAAIDSTGLACSIGAVVGIDCGFSPDAEPPSVVTDRDGITVTYQWLDFVADAPLALVWRFDPAAPGSRDNLPLLDGVTTAGEVESYSVEAFLPFMSDSVAEHVTTTAFVLVEHVFAELGQSDSSLEGWCPTYGASVDATQADPDGDYVYWYPLHAHRTSIVECESPTTAR